MIFRFSKLLFFINKLWRKICLIPLVQRKGNMPEDTNVYYSCTIQTLSTPMSERTVNTNGLFRKHMKRNFLGIISLVIFFAKNWALLLQQQNKARTASSCVTLEFLNSILAEEK